MLVTVVTISVEFVMVLLLLVPNVLIPIDHYLHVIVIQVSMMMDQATQFVNPVYTPVLNVQAIQSAPLA